MPRLQLCRPKPQRPADSWRARATHLTAGSWTLLVLAHQLFLKEVALAGNIHGSLKELSVGWVCTLDGL